MRKKYLYIVILSLLFTSAITFSIRFFKPVGNNEVKNTESEEFKNKTLPIIKGKTPYDLDALKNLYTALGVFEKKKYYQFNGIGEVVAEPKLVLTRRQPVYERASYNNGEFVLEGISPSNIKIAEVVNHHYENSSKGVFLVYKGTADEKGKNIKWQNEPRKYSKSEFQNKYGIRRVAPTPYIVNDYTTNIENTTQVRLANGNLKITTTLDPIKSSELYKRTIATQGNAKNFPLFKKVKIEFEIDKNWNVIKTSTYVEYFIDTYGGADCKSSMTHQFSYKNEPVFDREMYEKFFDSKIDDDNKEENPSALEVLTEAFAGYLLDGFNFEFTKENKNILNLSAYLNNGGINLSGNLNLFGIDILYDGKNLFINKDGKGYVCNISEFISLLNLFNINFNLDKSDLINKLSNLMEISKVSDGYDITIKYLGFKAVIKISSDKKVKGIKLYTSYKNLDFLNDVDIKLVSKKYEFVKVKKYDNLSSDIINYFKSLVENKEHKNNFEKAFSFNFKYKNITFDGKLKFEVNNNNFRFYLRSKLNDKDFNISYLDNYFYLEYDGEVIKLSKDNFNNILSNIIDTLNNKNIKDIFENILKGNFKEIFKNLNLSGLDIEAIIKSIILNRDFISYANNNFNFKLSRNGSLNLSFKDFNFSIKNINITEFNNLEFNNAKEIDYELLNNLLDIFKNIKNIFNTKELVLSNFNFLYKDYKFNGVLKFNLNDNLFNLSGRINFKNISSSIDLVIKDKIVYLNLFNKLNFKFSLNEIDLFNDLIAKFVKDFNKDDLNYDFLIKKIFKFIHNDEFKNLFNQLKKSIDNSSISFEKSNITLENRNYLDIKDIKNLLNNIATEYLDIKKDEKIEKIFNVDINYTKNDKTHKLNFDTYLYLSKNSIDISITGSYILDNTEIPFRLRYDGFNLFLEYNKKKISLKKELLFEIIDKYLPNNYGNTFNKFYNYLKENRIFDFIKDIKDNNLNCDLDNLFTDFIMNSFNLLISLKDNLDIKLEYENNISKLLVNKLFKDGGILNLVFKKSNLNKSDIILPIDEAKEIKKDLVDNITYLLEKFKKVYDSKKLKIDNFNYIEDSINFSGRLLFDLNNKKISLNAKFIVNKVKFNAEIIYENNRFYIKMLNNLKTYIAVNELNKLDEILSLLNIKVLSNTNLKEYLETFDILSFINANSIKNILDKSFSLLHDDLNLYKIVNNVLDVFKKSDISYDFSNDINLESSEYTNLLEQADFIKNIINSYKEKNLDKFLDDKYLLEGKVFNEKTLKEEINFNIRLSKSDDNNLRKVMFDLVLNDLLRDQVHKATIYYENGMFYLIYNNLSTKIKPRPLKYLISRILEIIGINNDLLFKLLDVELSGIESVIKDKIFKDGAKEVDLDDVCYDASINGSELGINLLKKIFEEFEPSFDLISKLVHKNGKLNEFILNNLYVSKNRRLDLKLTSSDHGIDANISDEKKDAAIDLLNIEKIADAFIKTQATRKYHLVATGANKEITLNIGDIASGIKFNSIDIKITVQKDGTINMHAHYFHDSWLSGTVTKNYMNDHDLYIKDNKMFLKRKFKYTWLSRWSYETYTNEQLRSKTKDDLIATLFSFGPSVQRAIKNNISGSESDPNYLKKIPPLDAILNGYRSIDELNYDINFDLQAITGNNSLGLLKTNLTINNGYLHKIKFNTNLSILNVFGEFELVQDNNDWEIEYPSDFK